MFQKLKQLKKVRDLQKSLAREKVDIEKDGVKITVNGNIEIEDIKLNPDLDITRQEKTVKDCVNDAVKKIQYIMAERMSDFKDLL